MSDSKAQPRPESESTTSSSIIDFEGVAALIDAVAAADPGRLPTLFRVLRSSDECLEARVVVEVTLRCRDPLAPLATLCRDAPQASFDFNRLLKSEAWLDVRQLCPDARAAALLNLCNEVLAEANPLKENRRRRCREIRPRLKLAAMEERSDRAEALERVITTRAVQCPSYWRLLRTFLARVISARP